MSLDNFFKGDYLQKAFPILKPKGSKAIDWIAPGTRVGMIPFEGQTPTEAPPIPEQVKPVSMTTGAVTDANVAARRAAKKRKGMASTILAGETLAGESQQSPYGQKTLLGGG